MPGDKSHSRPKQNTQKILRMERKHERITAHGPARCHFCGETDIRTLELHHPFGEANSDEMMPLCANCHSMASDMQQDWSAALLARPGNGEEKPLGETMAAFLAGIADMLMLFAETVADWLRALADWFRENVSSISGPLPPRVFAVEAISEAE